MNIHARRRKVAPGNTVASALLGLRVGDVPALRADPHGCVRPVDASGGLLLLDVEETPLERPRDAPAPPGRRGDGPFRAEQLDAVVRQALAGRSPAA